MNVKFICRILENSQICGIKPQYQNNQWIKEENKMETKKYLETNKNKNTTKFIRQSWNSLHSNVLLKNYTKKAERSHIPIEHEPQETTDRTTYVTKN